MSTYKIFKDLTCRLCIRPVYIKKAMLCRTHYKKKMMGDPNWTKPLRPKRTAPEKNGNFHHITCWVPTSVFTKILTRAELTARTKTAVASDILIGWAARETDSNEEGDIVYGSRDHSKEAVLKAVDGGELRISEIAAEFGISERTVHRYIAERKKANGLHGSREDEHQRLAGGVLPAGEGEGLV